MKIPYYYSKNKFKGHALSFLFFLTWYRSTWKVLLMDSSSTSSIPTMYALAFLYFFQLKTNFPNISNKQASTNQLQWKRKVMSSLRGHGLLGYVTNEIPCPPNTIIGEDGVSHSKLVVQCRLRVDQLILDWINNSISCSFLSSDKQ